MQIYALIMNIFDWSPNCTSPCPCLQTSKTFIPNLMDLHHCLNLNAVPLLPILCVNKRQKLVFSIFLQGTSFTCKRTPILNFLRIHLEMDTTLRALLKNKLSKSFSCFISLFILDRRLPKAVTDPAYLLHYPISLYSH